MHGCPAYLSYPAQCAPAWSRIGRCAFCMLRNGLSCGSRIAAKSHCGAEGALSVHADGQHGGQHVWRLVCLSSVQGSPECSDQVIGPRSEGEGHHSGPAAPRYGTIVVIVYLICTANEDCMRRGCILTISCSNQYIRRLPGAPAAHCLPVSSQPKN